MFLFGSNGGGLSEVCKEINDVLLEIIFAEIKSDLHTIF